MTIMASKFLSTPSARRATASDTQIIIRDVISIHALREEGDTPSAPSSRARPNFYPRPPRGGRRPDWTSVRRWLWISIHALREEGDWRPGDVGGDKGVFLSTPSARRATVGIHVAKGLLDISIHALREEGDERP